MTLQAIRLRGDIGIRGGSSCFIARDRAFIGRVDESGISGEDATKDIDFTAARHSLAGHGYTDTRRMLGLSSWDRPVDPMQGVFIYSCFLLLDVDERLC